MLGMNGRSGSLARLICMVALLAATLPGRALAVDNPLTVNLHGVDSKLQEAAATIFGSGSNVLVDVTRNRAVDDGAAITLNAGACSAPGAIAYALNPFQKYGSVTQLHDSLPHVAARAHSLIIHATGSTNSKVFACGNIVD